MAGLHSNFTTEPHSFRRVERIVSGRTKSNELSSLLPRAWKASQTQTTVNS
jgi:hypothetical protein